MKTLRISLALVSALVASVAFAGPRGKTTPAPAGSARVVATADTPDTTGCDKMIEKNGKRTSTVACAKDTAKCEAHCAK